MARDRRRRLTIVEGVVAAHHTPKSDSYVHSREFREIVRAGVIDDFTKNWPSLLGDKTAVERQVDAFVAMVERMTDEEVIAACMGD
ncbi:MAG: hypothetical protein ACHREM_04265 [Polyangiales bacterium]